MDDLLEGRRGIVRIGVIITAMSAAIVVVAALGPGRASDPWWLALAGITLLTATGIGLLFCARFARVLAGLLFLGGAVLAPISLIGDLTGMSMPDGLDPWWLLSIANAVATTLLIVWLCYRAIRVLLGTTRSAAMVTARLVGGVLVLVGASHLWLAGTVDEWHVQGAWSFRMSPSGTSFAGFVGWPLWHLALLGAALVMLAGPRRLLVGATTAVLVLIVGTVPLVAVSVAGSGFFDAAWIALLLAMMSLPAYLMWWLRDELRRLRAR